MIAKALKESQTQVGTNTVIAAVAQGRGLLEKLAAEVIELEKHREKLLLERQHLIHQRSELLTKPLSQEDIVNVALGLVDRRANSYKAFCEKEGMFDFLAYPKRVTESRQWAMNFSDAEMLLGNSLEGAEIEVPKILDCGLQIPLINQSNGWLYFFFGDLIKEKLKAQIEATGLPLTEQDRQAFGPSIAERRATIAACNKALDKLNAQIQQVDAAIAELSVNLDTPDVRKQDVAGIQQRVKDSRKKLEEIFSILSDMRSCENNPRKKDVFHKVRTAAWAHDEELKRTETSLRGLTELGIPHSRYHDEVPAMKEKVANIEDDLMTLLGQISAARRGA